MAYRYLLSGSMVSICSRGTRQLGLPPELPTPGVRGGEGTSGSPGSSDIELGDSSLNGDLPLSPLPRAPSDEKGRTSGGSAAKRTRPRSFVSSVMLNWGSWSGWRGSSAGNVCLRILPEILCTGHSLPDLGRGIDTTYPFLPSPTLYPTSLPHSSSARVEVL